MKKCVLKRNLGIALVALLAMAMLGIACDSDKEPSAPPPSAPGGNQPPVISSLTPEQTQTHASGNIEIRCTAEDPDGDKVSYEWAATGGSFSETGASAGAVVTWKAPEDYGDYDITVTVEDGKGGNVQSALTLTVGSNQSPQISSLIADPNSILPGSSTTITVIATDPDGDKISYSWSGGEGEVTGVGNKVTWKAPRRSGTFDVTVVISDGEGGKTIGTVPVVASAATSTMTLTVVQEETGTVSSDGDKDKSRNMAGDDENNTGYRAFWSFNIINLWDSEIHKAELKFTTRNQAGDPFSKTTGLNGLRLWKVNYGQDKLPSYDTSGQKLDNSTAVVYAPPNVIDVTPEIINLVKSTSTRFQVGALFMDMVSDGDDVAEWIDWSDVTLTVTYSQK